MIFHPYLQNLTTRNTYSTETPPLGLAPIIPPIEDITAEASEEQIAAFVPNLEDAQTDSDDPSQRLSQQTQTSLQTPTSDNH